MSEPKTKYKKVRPVNTTDISKEEALAKKGTPDTANKKKKYKKHVFVMTAFEKDLKKILIDRDMTMEKLAARMDVKYSSSLNQLLRGTAGRCFRERHFAQICEILKCDIQVTEKETRIVNIQVIKEKNKKRKPKKKQVVTAKKIAAKYPNIKKLAQPKKVVGKKSRDHYGYKTIIKPAKAKK